MSRMGEWFMEWREDDDIDLMLAALHHEEELHQQQLEQEARRFPVVIHPRAFTHESGTSSAESVPPVLSLQWLPPPPRAR